MVRYVIFKKGKLWILLDSWEQKQMGTYFNYKEEGFPIGLHSWAIDESLLLCHEHGKISDKLQLLLFRFTIFHRGSWRDQC